MAPTDTHLLDLPTFLRTLRGERRTAMLIHGAPLVGKSRFARQLSEKVDGGYLDVLATISQRPDLSAAIDQFDPAALRLLALKFSEAEPKDFIVVDEIDFLFPLWSGDFSPFQNMLADLYNLRQPTAFVFFVRSRPEWETWQLQTAARQSRVVDFECLKAL